MNSIKLVYWLTTIILVGLEVYAIAIDSRYKWDFIFLMLMLSAVYMLRQKIDLHPLHYTLLAVFLLLHFLGMFGLYQTYPLGIEYDYWVHGYFGFLAALNRVSCLSLLPPLLAGIYCRSHAHRDSRLFRIS